MQIFGNPYAAEFSTNRSRGKELDHKNYQMTTRYFRNGGIEILTRLIDPVKQRKYEESRALGGMVSNRRKAKEYSPAELEALDKSNYERSTRRAKQQVRFHIKSMAADHLVTLTYRSSDGAVMNDIEQLKRDWKRFVRLVRYGLPASGNHPAHPGLDEWPFVAVPELQRNGAYHLHIAVAGRQDIGYIRRCWYMALGGSQDDAGGITRGQVNVRGPSKRFDSALHPWDANNISGYMTKYLSKTFESSGVKRGGKRYWVGYIPDKPVVAKRFLPSNDMNEALVDTFKLFIAHDIKLGMKVWKSENLDCVWMAGTLEDAPAPLG